MKHFKFRKTIRHITPHINDVWHEVIDEEGNVFAQINWRNNAYALYFTDTPSQYQIWDNRKTIIKFLKKHMDEVFGNGNYELDIPDHWN